MIAEEDGTHLVQYAILAIVQGGYNLTVLKAKSKYTFIMSVLLYVDK